MKDEFHNSRSEQRAKRRKTNLILNGLIAVVLLLIIVISANIFLGDDKADTEEKIEKIENQANTKDTKKEEAPTNEDQALNREQEETTVDATEELEEDTPTDDEGEVVETEGGSDANVKKTLVNPAWKPVGTTQTGEHTTVYDQNAADWQEMLNAISYATGVDQANMTVLFLGNNGPNKSVGTILAKEQQQKYKVYIEWVDKEGWKPTKVEELNN